MIVYLRNILSLNERFAYNLIGKLRDLISPFFDNFLKLQEKRIKKKLAPNITNLRRHLINILPQVDTDDLIKEISNAEKKDIIFNANKILLNEFEILSTKVKFQKKIDWHLDFKSGYRWPKGKLYSKYNQVDKNNSADVKFPRELSRCHHFLYLGEAYLLTSDEKYTKEFIAQIRNWILENPYKKSINWGCSMDIAIRASNWIYSLNMFAGSLLIDDVFFHEIMTSLYLHGRYIYENPEKNRVYNHNHYLSDLAGQILISIVFETTEIKETKSWKENGIYEFFREIRVQILPTGLHMKEQRITTD